MTESSSVTITVDGRPTHVSGTLSEGTVIVPLRRLFEPLGFRVDWFPAQGRAVVSDGRHTLTLYMSGTKAWAGDHEITIYPAPRIEGGKILVPLTFVAENLGFSVHLDAAANTANLLRIMENPIIIHTKRIRQETRNLSMDIQYPQVSGLGLAMDTAINAPLADWAERLRAEGIRSAAEAVTIPPNYQATVVGNYKTAYNEHGILSVVLEAYTFAGGAHGLTTRTAYTFDLFAGKTWSLKDLFKPGVDYVSILSRDVKKQMDERDLTSHLLNPFEAIAPNQDYYLQDDAIVIYFGLYEYFPYVFGIQEFPVLLASLRDVLVPRLAAIPGKDAGA